MSSNPFEFKINVDTTPVGDQANKQDDEYMALAAVGEGPFSQSPVEPDPIAELERELGETIKLLDETTPHVKQLDAMKDLVKAQKAEYMIEVNNRLREFESHIRQAEEERKKVIKAVEEAEARKKRLLADISHMKEAQEAQELLKKARKRWQDIIEANDWHWAQVVREYQMTAIQFTASGLDRDLGGIAILDQMGLGKSLEASGSIDLIQSHPYFPAMLKERLPDWNESAGWTTAVLWLCPDQIKGTSAEELRKWSNRPVVVLDGPPERRDALVTLANQHGAMVVAGYAQIRNRGNKPVTPAIFESNWPIVVMDEVQMAKNRDSSTFQNLAKLVQKSGYVIPMTGTPIENKPEEFWTILYLLTQKGKRQGEFQKFSWFERSYLWGSSFDHGAFDRLMNSVSDMLIRRRKDEVGIELPDKQITVHTVQMTGRQRELYNMMRDRLYVWLDEQKSDYIGATNFLAQLTRLRQINLLPSSITIENGDGTKMVLDCDESAKVDEAMEWIRQIISNDEKVLIFSNFNHVLYRIQQLVAEEALTWTDKDGKTRPVLSGAITGDVKNYTRDQYVAEFNDPNSDLRVMVGNIMAMGLGLNLQGACSEEIFLDLYWNPGKNEQAMDRLHRMGQKNNVNVRIIQTEDSVDGFIAAILEEKQGISNFMFERDSLRRALDDGLI